MENGSKDESLNAAKQYYSSLPKDKQGALTIKELRQNLVDKFGNSYLELEKVDLINIISESNAATQSISNTETKNEEVDDNDNDSGTDSNHNGVNDEDEDDPRFSQLPDEWKSTYGNIMWAKTQNSYPWYLNFNVLCIMYNVVKVAVFRIRSRNGWVCVKGKGSQEFRQKAHSILLW